jgi:hypothetical protein
MTTCPSPHPQRGADGLAPFDAFEALGSRNSDSWGRCRRCGRFFWLATDLGGKYEYLGGAELDPSTAERALVDHDLDAVVILLLRHGLPVGPVWESEHALLDLLRQLAPSSSDEQIAQALSRASAPGLWGHVIALVRGRAEAARAAAPVPLLSFELEIFLDTRGLREWHELPQALVSYREEPPFEIVRLDAAGTIGQLGLRGQPRWLGGDDSRLIWAVGTSGAERVLTLGADGAMFFWSPTPWRYASVMALDAGWWLFVREPEGEERWLELRRPDTSQLTRFRMRAGPGASMPAPPRRVGEEWLASGVVTDEGEEIALAVFDAGLGLVARSALAGSNRLLAPLGDGSVVWAETTAPPFTLERWVREGELLHRTLEMEVAGWCLTGDRVVAFRRQGGLVGLDRDGVECWRRDVPWGYLTRADPLVLLTHPESVELLRPGDGATVERWEIHAEAPGPDVLQDHTGALYVSADQWLWIMRQGRVLRVAFPHEAELLTTCGDAALLGDPDTGHYLLVAHDGSIRGGFEAQDATFSVAGTHAGPYVVEAERIRVGAFWDRLTSARGEPG